MQVVERRAKKTRCQSAFTRKVVAYWRIHKGNESLAPEIEKKIPPGMISDQIPRKSYTNLDLE